MPLEPESDLPWTAFRYVAGELTPAEASDFEAILADDQDARDAVADAVELAGALALVGPEFRARRRPVPLRAAFAASALVAAACFALAILPRPRTEPPERPDASAVALAWSSLRGDPDALPAPAMVDADAAIESDDEIGVDAPAGRALPSWLLSAASVPPDDAPRQED